MPYASEKLPEPTPSDRRWMLEVGGVIEFPSDLVSEYLPEVFHAVQAWFGPLPVRNRAADNGRRDRKLAVAPDGLRQFLQYIFVAEGYGTPDDADDVLELMINEGFVGQEAGTL